MVDTTEARVGGRRIAGRGDLEPLRAHLTGLRKHWKVLHPDEDFDPLADVTVPRDTSFIDGISVLEVLGHSGYPRLVVHDGEVSVSFDLRVPGPPRASPESTRGPT